MRMIMSGLRKVIAMMLVCVFIGSIPCVSYASPTILTQTRQIGGGYYNTTSKINFTVENKKLHSRIVVISGENNL